MTFKSFFALTALTLTCSLTFSAQEISSAAQFDAEIAQSTKPVIVKFSASWCGPCKQFAPLFDSTSREAKYQQIKFLKVDTDRLSAVANRYNIRSVPTTIFFKNGREVGRINGAPSRADFTTQINKYFAI